MQCVLLTLVSLIQVLSYIYSAVSTIIIKPIVFHINFDGVVLFFKLQQSYKLFKLCAKFHHLRFTNKGIIQGGTPLPRLCEISSPQVYKQGNNPGGNTPHQTNMLSEDPSPNRVNGPAVLSSNNQIYKHKKLLVALS